MTTLLRLAALVLLTLLLTACASSAPADRAELPTGGVLIEPAELAAALNSPSAPIILDARSESDFLTSRLPGARRLDMPALTKLAREKGFDDTAAWHARFGQMGLAGADQPIVVYDAGGMTTASAAWFFFQQFGLTNVRVLNGGFKHWPASNLVTGPAEVPVATNFTPPASPARPFVRNETKADLKAAVASRDADTKILDVRSRDEYAGKELMNNTRGGHLPGAINLPHADLMNDGIVKSRSELRAMFAAAGLRPGDRIVTHCQGGGRASLGALALIHAGYGTVANYYMSFGEWAADESCPVELPE
ncbi:MAG: rhodanese-like domain-containing protein [Planctomycetota bacterium]|nr:rhodanese-like domain-containing protein [Planctomycetota bacterium]